MTYNRHSEAAKKHIMNLLNLLASRADSLSRNEIFRRYASQTGMHSYEKLFDDMEKRDKAQLDWLKEQIRRYLDEM